MLISFLFVRFLPDVNHLYIQLNMEKSCFFRQNILITQLSHKQMTGVLNQYGEKQEEKRSIDNQAGTQFAESKLPKSG